MAAPSPITKPSRSTSKGLLAFLGSSLCLDRARSELNPATAMGQMGASAPPARTMSASSRRSISSAWPMASAPLEHDDTAQKFRPMGPGGHGDLGGCHVRQHHGNEEGGNPAGAFLPEDVVLLGERHDAADTAADDGRDPEGVHLAGSKLGLPQRLLGRHRRELGEPVHPAGFLFLHVVRGVEARTPAANLVSKSAASKSVM